MSETSGTSNSRATAASLIMGLAVIYIVWGSTYYAIRVAVETIPPFLMAGVRFLIAGAILLVWARIRGATMPTGQHWRFAILTGTLLMFCGNGIVVWAERYVASGLVALLLTTTPLWMVLFNWLRPKGIRPPMLIWVGLIAGFAGTAALAYAGQRDGNKEIDLFGVAALMGASIAWALGSVIVKHGPRPDSAVLGTAQQMLCGGVVLVAFSGISGELTHFELSQVTLGSFLGWLYLLVVGSLLTMPVYTWLLHSTEPSLVSTYSFVNPVIAVIIGWALAGEKLTSETIIAGGVIVVSVAWLIGVQWRFSRSNRSVRKRLREPAPPEIRIGVR